MCLLTNDKFIVPDKLYKYYGNIDHLISALNHQGVYMDNPINFNDPFDELYAPYYLPSLKTKTYVCFEQIFQGLLKNKSFIKKYIVNNCDNEMQKFIQYRNSVFNSEEIAKKYRLVINIYDAANIIKEKTQYEHEIIDEVVSDIINEKNSKKINIVDEMRRVSCFCETKESLPMWAYYAKNCTGFCVEYDISLLDDETRECIKPVLYSAHRESNSESFHKSSQWMHEKEWRIIKSANDKSIKDNFLKFDCVSAIYFGKNCDFSNTYDEKSCWHAPYTYSAKIYSKYAQLIREVENQSNQIKLFKTDAKLNEYGFYFTEFYSSK